MCLNIYSTHLKLSTSLYPTETFTNGPSSDLQPVVLEVFVNLMRAQARECILRRQQMDNLRNFETLQTESQCLESEYSKIHNVIQTIQSNSINLPPCCLPWEAIIPAKTEYFKALSHVYVAKSLAQEKSESVDEKNRFKTIKAHLQASQASHEEILRLQRMCRELRVSAKSLIIRLCHAMTNYFLLLFHAQIFPPCFASRRTK